MTKTAPSTQDKPREITSVTVLGARITWVAWGPMVLAFTTLGIVSRGNGWLTGLDLFFAAVVGSMILGRWVEQRSGAATTLDGEPATPRHYTRYVRLLLSAALVVWIIANVLGNHILM